MLIRNLLSKTNFLAVVLAASTCFAQTQIQVTVETLSNLGQAPVIASFSDGTYDIFTNGQAASSALETLAEVGAPSGFVGALAPPEGGPVFGNNPSPPIFTPNGGTNSAVFTVSPGNNQFNFATMLLPSNDWFVGNSMDLDISSLLSGPVGSSITMSYNTVYDAGTETEDFNASAGNPLVGLPGVDATLETDQNGVVTMVTAADPFSTFANIPAGFDTTQYDFITSGASLVQVTLTTVPEPSSIGLLSFGFLGLCGLARRRRNRRS